jgi:hypothetical protein
MRVLEPPSANAKLLPARRGYAAAIDPDPDPEPKPFADRPPASAAEVRSGSVQTEYPLGDSPEQYSTGQLSTGHFTEAEVRNMQRDDAMAGGMIAVILTLAFVVLLSLTICVNIWMLRVSP